jgi:acyl-CoA thioesterase-2
MSRVLGELVELLALERIEENLFRGASQDLGWGTIFGGQVLGQALSAAVQTVAADRRVHSLHAYFLRPGDPRRPVLYDVDRIRDGSSFTTRRVVAVQRGQAIFNLQCSFQVDEDGFEHQDAMPEVPPPETLPTEQERMKKHAANLPAFAFAERPFEVRAVEEIDDPFAPAKRSPRRAVWFRAVAPLPDDDSLHRYLLAYASDYAFLSTSLFPHGVTWRTPGMQVASIDHVMHFHRPFRADGWLLHVMESPAARGARGLVRGRVFTREGALVASTQQEGLIRMRKKEKKP